MSDLHPIKVVARRTGLSPHVIRAWEKRYKAVTPRRTPTNRRVYRSEDIERLILLRRATLAGRSIGQIAQMPTEELRELVNEDELAQSQAPVPTSVTRPRTSNGTLEAALNAVENLDPEGLQAALERASVTMSRPALIEQIVAPLLGRVGDAWRDGSLRVASEHLAAATLRTFLGNMNGTFPALADAPRLLVTTPAGQLHELGALIAGTAAAAEGWHITYLGPSLPAEEIVAAAQMNQSRAVALSIVLADDAHLKGELARLGQLMPDNIAILIGGRASSHYADVIHQIGAIGLHDLQGLRNELDSLRSGTGPSDETE
jgi:DNA-binding transcriptional MerR regulator/methylmalonyl-CoA mutase cobalamin-binding subunit